MTPTLKLWDCLGTPLPSPLASDHRESFSWELPPSHIISHHCFLFFPPHPPKSLTCGTDSNSYQVALKRIWHFTKFILLSGNDFLGHGSGGIYMYEVWFEWDNMYELILKMVKSLIYILGYGYINMEARDSNRKQAWQKEHLGHSTRLLRKQASF